MHDRSALAGLLMAAIVGLAGCAAPARDAGIAGSGLLAVRIEGVAASGGSVAVALFDSEAAFAAGEPPAARARLAADGESCEWEIVSLPFGDYAVKAYQDRNDNGVLDRGAMGVPSEPYGFSNDARGRLGPPGWAAARFTHRQGRTRIAIELR